ncbi:MAG: glutamyl-tRNA reductase [Planctomycetota bacterium]|nr:glutamyl-tRNA reductase [Planctomycetota bacterium]
MKFQLVGCSHSRTSIEIREKLAFSAEQVQVALKQFRESYPNSEAVLLSTCNRTEFYAASESESAIPTHQQMIEFLARARGLKVDEIRSELFTESDETAVRHLFTVASSLDSMVIGEAQILGQVKQAYELAVQDSLSMPLSHMAFQTALMVAKKVASGTSIQHKRISIPSVAVCEFARQIFERFDDKKILVIGAGEMAEETLVYLKAEGANRISVVNRNMDRALELASQFDGQARPWKDLMVELESADLVVSTTGATEPIVTSGPFGKIKEKRMDRTLFVLDLAIPRDFAAEIAEFPNVYLFTIDDLQSQCEENRRSREKEWPKAQRIIEKETGDFMAEVNRRMTGPTIKRVRELAAEIKELELVRLVNKLELRDEKIEKEISISFDRLINKLLHPPLESIRDEARSGEPTGLLNALKRLFQITD